MGKRGIKNNDFNSVNNKITPFEFIESYYSNPKIKIIKKAWNNDNKIIFKTKYYRYQINFDEDFNIVKSRMIGLRVIPGILSIAIILLLMPINDYLIAILIIPVILIHWTWYKEKKELVNDLQVFLDDRF